MIQGGAWIPKHPGRACGGPWRSHRGRLSQRQRAALKTLDSGRPKRLKHRHLFFEWPTLPTPNNEKQQHFQIFHKSDFQDAPGFQGIQPFFFLMSQQCLNENFQECCNMFRCSGSRPTFDIWHFKTTTFSNEIFRRGAWIQDGVAPDPVRRSKFELLNFWNLQKIKSMFAGAWMGPRWI